MATIDGKDLIAGRIATVVAKRLLLGESIDIVNCEKIVLTGSKDFIIKRFTQKRRMGIPLKGPYFPRDPERLIRRIIRGMLPYKKDKGASAFKRLNCYVGVPENLKDQKMETIEGANVSKVPDLKFMNLKEISKVLGSKIVERMDKLEKWVRNQKYYKHQVLEKEQ